MTDKIDKTDWNLSLLDELELSDVQHFQDSIVWRAIEEYIDFSIEQSHAVLESSVDIDLIRNAQGRIAELRTLRSLPETVKQQIEMNKEKEE